ncbi:MAG: hypothetical protein ABI112_09820 [Terracoccus sp.]
MSKYLLLQHYRGGPEPYRAVPPMDQWAQEDVETHMAFHRNVGEWLEENGGTVVDGQALTPARVGALWRAGCRARHHRWPVARDRRVRGLRLIRACPGWYAAVRVD